MRQTNRKLQTGFALIAVLLMLAVLTTLLGAYLVITKIELATLKASKDTTSGFYAAEGGLNIRAEGIRSTFIGYNVPTGTSPNTTNPCSGTNLGSGDFRCLTYTLGNRSVKTYIIDHQNGGDPPSIRIPQGELYQNLNAQEYKYTATSEATGREKRTEALLQLRFKSRLVPLFQFAAFYNKDLEINPGPAMTLAGPVHTNGDLYLNPEASLSIDGQVTAAGTIYRGRKDNRQTPNCKSFPTKIKDPTNYRTLIPTCSSRVTVTTSDIAPFNNMVQFGVPVVTVPEPERLDPTPGKLYWDHADLRLILNLTTGDAVNTSNIATGIEVRYANDTINSAATTTLYGCSGLVRRNPNASTPDTTLSAVGTSYAFKNNREGKTIRMLDVDIQGLLNCLQNNNFLGYGTSLADTTDAGLVFFLTVKGPNSSSTANGYGIRVRNGAELKSTVATAPAIQGLTIVSDQAVYLQGDYNSVSTSKKPAAVMCDSFNVLSNYWWDSTNKVFRDSLSTNSDVTVRKPPSASYSTMATTQNVAVLSGTDTSGGIEGSAGQGGSYNGGLENYPRFHEDWSGAGVTYTYRGSFVSLNQPRHVNGGWVYGSPQYTAPTRDWNYDTTFNNASKLPPISPRFVYLRQELFVRDFEQ